jgi:hypothetical protein
MRLRILVSSMLLFTLASCSVLGIGDSPAPPLTKAQAKKALLTRADFPKGWTRDADESTDDTKVTRGSKACKQVVDGPDDEAPTQLERAFTSPDETTTIGHSIESYVEGEARREFNRDVLMIDACDRFTLGDGKDFSVRFTLGLVHFKDMGDDSAAYQAVGNLVPGVKVFVDSAAVRVGQNVVAITSFRVGSAIPDRKLRNYLKLAIAKLDKVVKAD